MCGIAGIDGFEDEALLRKMCDILSHRGPDDRGYFVDQGVCLGNTRLSIIDVAGGHQPIHNEDNTIWVTFNGEIYNFLDLRRYLMKNGHQFHTESDTEVIVHAYEEWGDLLADKLRGMFAFAIWDGNSRKLLLARDRLGKKPVYYVVAGRGLLFASEIKAILQYEEVPRKVNIEALDRFLTFRYVPGRFTMFEGINKLLPGEVLLYQNKEVRLRRYWNLEFCRCGYYSEDYYVNMLRSLLEESVKMRLMSEVPLGAYLSGGTDSSLVVAMMSKYLKEPVKTFTVGFGDEQFDESKYARIVANYFNTDHHEFVADPTEADILPRVVWHFDEPVADPAAIPTLLLSQLAKKYVTVVLTGEGGDELFAGYEHYGIMAITSRYLKGLPAWVRNQVIPAAVQLTPNKVVNLLFKYRQLLGEEGLRRVRMHLENLSHASKSYLDIVSIFDEEEKSRLYVDATKKLVNYRNASREVEALLQAAPPSEVVSKILLFETKVQLPENLLMKVDKMTMASSIEARAPLLDHKLVEFCATIPFEMKLRGLTGKYILRKAMAGILPEQIVRRKKQRFFVPIHTWLEGELGDVASQVLDESHLRKRGYFDHRFIRHIFKDWHRSRLYYSRQIWSLLTFEIWHRIFIDSDNLARPCLSLDKLAWS